MNIEDAMRQLGITEEDMKILNAHVTNCLICQSKGLPVAIKLKHWIDDCLKHAKSK